MPEQILSVVSRIGVLAPRIVVEAYSVPSPVDAFKYSPYRIDAHVVSSDGERPGVGLVYMDGPSATIFLKVDTTEFEVGKGQGVVTYFREPQPGCTRFRQNGEVFYPMAGSYMLLAAAGYVRPEEAIFYVTDAREVAVEAKPIQVASKTVKYVTAPALAVPMWVLLAAGVGGALLAGVIIAEATRPR